MFGARYILVASVLLHVVTNAAHPDYGAELDTPCATDLRLVSNFRLRSFRTSSVSPPKCQQVTQGQMGLACVSRNWVPRCSGDAPH
jgi:hypothetical protein